MPAQGARVEFDEFADILVHEGEVLTCVVNGEEFGDPVELATGSKRKGNARRFEDLLRVVIIGRYRMCEGIIGFPVRKRPRRDVWRDVINPRLHLLR